MRVLWVLHTPRDPTTGVFAAVSADAESLRSRGHQVEILTPGDLLSGWRRSPRWLPLAWPWAALRWVLRGPQFDVLIFHSFAGWGPALVRRWSPRLARAVFVTQFHGLEPLYRRAGRLLGPKDWWRGSILHSLYRGPIMNVLLSVACRRSDLVLCLNEAERAHLLGRGWGERESVGVVHPPVPAAFFGDRDYGQRVERLVFVGQWHPGKGTRELAESLRILRESGLSIALVCAGTRVEEERVLSDFPLSVRSAVEVIPGFERAKLPSLLARCDVLIHPSYSEGSSLAVREAMAAGMPIVASPVGACPDLLRDRESVVMVPVGDPRALAAAIAEYAQDKELRRRCGEGARAVAERIQAEESLADLLEARVAARHGRDLS